MASAAGPPWSQIVSRLFVYQTPSKLYLVGCAEDKKTWRILKVDRLEPRTLNVDDDGGVTYTKEEANAVLSLVHDAHIRHGGLQLVCKGYTILGAINFLQGYYLLVVTRKRQRAVLQGHPIYEMQGTECVPITHPGLQSQYHPSSFPDERVYRRMLLASIDWTKQFYFSYGYILPFAVQRNLKGQEAQEAFESRFVWNSHLTKALRQVPGTSVWIVPVIHGSVEQKSMSIYGRDVTVTLLGRRSRLFAGTRYLKRGVNGDGNCANDVEVEQIVDVGRTIAGHAGKVAAHVQARASVPLYWTQDSYLPRANISLQSCDPLFVATERHFADLRRRYGAPVVVLDLVKQRANERVPRESLLGDEYARAVAVVNGAMPESERVRNVRYDFSHQAKVMGPSSVLKDLLDVARKATSDLGCFVAFLVRGSEGPGVPRKLATYTVHQQQSGVLRTNCVDCIDRSNIAQFVVGLAVLGRQLHATGVTETPLLGLEKDVAVTLTSLYKDMGDQLAQQYGGSEAHAGVLDQHSGGSSASAQYMSLMTSLRRAYSNNMLDPEKQDALNLVLGHYRPQLGKPAIWDIDQRYLQVGASLAVPGRAPEALPAVQEVDMHGPAAEGVGGNGGECGGAAGADAVAEGSVPSSGRASPALPSMDISQTSAILDTSMVESVEGGGVEADVDAWLRVRGADADEGCGKAGAGPGGWDGAGGGRVTAVGAERPWLPAEAEEEGAEEALPSIPTLRDGLISLSDVQDATDVAWVALGAVGDSRDGAAVAGGGPVGLPRGRRVSLTPRLSGTSSAPPSNHGGRRATASGGGGGSRTPPLDLSGRASSADSLCMPPRHRPPQHSPWRKPELPKLDISLISRSSAGDSSALPETPSSKGLLRSVGARLRGIWNKLPFTPRSSNVSRLSTSTQDLSSEPSAPGKPLGFDRSASDSAGTKAGSSLAVIERLLRHASGSPVAPASVSGFSTPSRLELAQDDPGVSRAFQELSKGLAESMQIGA